MVLPVMRNCHAKDLLCKSQAVHGKGLAQNLFQVLNSMSWPTTNMSLTYYERIIRSQSENFSKTTQWSKVVLLFAMSDYKGIKHFVPLPCWPIEPIHALLDNTQATLTCVEI